MQKNIVSENFISQYDRIEHENASRLSQLSIPEQAFVDHNLDHFAYERDFPLEKLYIKYGFNMYDD